MNKIAKHKIQSQKPEAIIVSGRSSISVFCMVGMFITTAISVFVCVGIILSEKTAEDVIAAVLLACIAVVCFGAMVYFYRFIKNRMLIIDNNEIMEITVNGEERIHKKEDFVNCRTTVYKGSIYGFIYFKDSKIYIGSFMSNIHTAIDYIERYYKTQETEVNAKTQITEKQTVQKKEEEDKFNRTIGKWMLGIAGIILCINVICRVVDARNSKEEYIQVTGTVMDVEVTSSWTRAGNHSTESPSYRVLIEYQVPGDILPNSISESYFFDIFSEGDTVPVLYRKDAVYRAYVAKKDWMTGAYLPISKWYNVPFIIAIVLFVLAFYFCTNHKQKNSDG